MQTIAREIEEQLGKSSWIRRMFETGAELKQRLGPDKVCDFSLGNPDLPPPPEAADALRVMAARLDRPLALGYPPNAGLPELRRRLAAKLAAEQQTPDLQAGHVLITCGAAGALTSFFRAVLEPGDEIVCPAPYFVEYAFYCGHFGGVLKPVPARPPTFDLDLDALIGAVGPRTRVVLINSPNNPTGCIYPEETLRELGRRLDEINRTRSRPVYLVSDEPYRFLAYDGAQVAPVLPTGTFSVVAGSFSKNLSMAGERIGFLAFNPAIPEVTRLIDATTMTIRTLGFVNAPVLGQMLAAAILDCQVDLEIYKNRRRAICDVLQRAGLKFAPPRGAFYVFPEAPGGDDVGFVRRLLAENILAVPGTGFGFPGYFRLSFSVDLESIQRSAPGFRRAVEGRTS